MKGFAIGEKVAKRIPELVRYTSISGIYRGLGMNPPYLLEVLLLRHEEKTSVVYAINRSPSIWYWPFRLSKEFTCEIRSGRKRQEINFKSSVQDFLRETGFLKGEGYKMFIHLVCPRLSFFEKSKNAILFDDFMDPLVQAMEPHLRIIKKQERAKSRTSSFGSLSAPVVTGKLSQKGLMFHYFIEGYRMASGDGQYVTTARQVFYAVRKFIIDNEGITLTNSDFDTFTQKVLTVTFEREPDLMRQIYFEQRDTFIDYDTKEEFPICTRTVTEYLDRLTKRANCICTLEPGEYRKSSLSFDYPPELRVSSVLFVEKQGFREVLQSSGIQDELGLNLILSQGYGTRDMKRLIEAFLDRGITVYVLHDCDIDGYQIKNKLLEGSETYSTPLKVVDIGLTLQDVKSLDKLIDAEKYTPERSYKNVLESMSDEEREFFWPSKGRGGKNGGQKYTYRRVD